jgi:RHS repeat-associated protein
VVSEDRIYLANWELYRRYAGDPEDPIDEVESHHVFAGDDRVLLVDDVLQTRDPVPGASPQSSGPRWQYQYSDHLGSCGVELDERARVVSYEAFHPHGTSAFRLTNSTAEAPQKRYRHAGKERDAESGLAYYGARYLAPSLGKWMAADPVASEQRLNRYAHVGNDPVNRIDKDGRFDELVHGVATYHLAIAAGFTQEQAKQLALGAALPDHDPLTRPLTPKGLPDLGNMRSGRTKEWHFPGERKAFEGVTSEIRSGKNNLVEIGRRLHPYEDVGAYDALGPHSRGTKPQELVGVDIGHPVYRTETGEGSHAASHVTDLPSSNPEQNRALLRKTFLLLVLAKRSLEGTSTEFTPPSRTGTKVDLLDSDAYLSEAFVQPDTDRLAVAEGMISYLVSAESREDERRLAELQPNWFGKTYMSYAEVVDENVTKHTTAVTWPATAIDLQAPPQADLDKNKRKR